MLFVKYSQGIKSALVALLPRCLFLPGIALPGVRIPLLSLEGNVESEEYHGFMLEIHS